MPRPHRLDFRGAIHYVHVRGRDGASVFFDSQILRSVSGNPRGSVLSLLEFERLLAEVGAECGSRLHGYCVEPNAATLVVQTAGAPLEAFMQRLCGQYSRHWHGQVRASPSADTKVARVFSGRYESKVLASEYVAHAVRRAHLRPVLAGLCARAVDYAFGSAAAYFGRPARVPLDVSAVIIALQRRGLVGLQGYRQFVEQSETPFVANLFERGCAFDSRVIGSKLFVMQARQRAAHPPPAPTREQLIAGVARLIHKEPAGIVFIESCGRAGAIPGGVVWNAGGGCDLERNWQMVFGERGDVGTGDSPLSASDPVAVQFTGVAGTSILLWH